MSKGDTIYRFYTKCGTARRLATQQVRYDHTKKINCGCANCSLFTEYHSLLAPDEFIVILRTTTDEFNVIPRTQRMSDCRTATCPNVLWYLKFKVFSRFLRNKYVGVHFAGQGKYSTSDASDRQGKWIFVRRRRGTEPAVTDVVRRGCRVRLREDRENPRKVHQQRDNDRRWISGWRHHGNNLNSSWTLARNFIRVVGMAASSHHQTTRENKSNDRMVERGMVERGDDVFNDQSCSVSPWAAFQYNPILYFIPGPRRRVVWILLSTIFHRTFNSFLFNELFFVTHLRYPDDPVRTQVIVRALKMGYDDIPEFLLEENYLLSARLEPRWLSFAKV